MAEISPDQTGSTQTQADVRQVLDGSDAPARRNAVTTPQKHHRTNLLPDGCAHLIYWPVAIVGIIADLWTKHAVFAWLKDKPEMEHVVIPACLRMVRWENDGAAFSLARGQTPVLLAISVAALVLVVAIFLFGRIHSRLMQLALALFTGGIAGNLYDRAFNNGLVRDFIDVYIGNHHWPAFNAADSMLCIAVGLLLIGSFTSASSQKHAGEQK